jgi:hypothetical protein
VFVTITATTAMAMAMVITMTVLELEPLLSPRAHLPTTASNINVDPIWAGTLTDMTLKCKGLQKVI